MTKKGQKQQQQQKRIPLPTWKRNDSMRKNRRKGEGLGKRMPKKANRFAGLSLGPLLSWNTQENNLRALTFTAKEKK